MLIYPTKEFLEVFKSTPGALSVTESIAIINIASLAPGGIYLELGAYRGKSAMSALVSLKNGIFYLVEPEFNDEIEFNEMVIRLGYKNHVSINLIKAYSTDIIGDYNNLCYVFVDSGSHQDGLPMREVTLLEDKVVQGGIVAFHDWNSQFKEVKEASDYLVSTGKYEYIPINWDEIISYVNENNLEEGNNSWHHTELKNPCFVGALKRK